MLLKHHALDANENSDEDVKACIDKEIANREETEEEEVENSEEENEDSVVNREEIDALKEELATLRKEQKGLKAPIHNRSKAGQPEVNLDQQEDELEVEGQVIANRASEIQKLHPGMSLGTSFLLAEKEIVANRKPAGKK